MWQDIRLLNATANALLGLLALAILGSALWWVVHRPLFTLREVRLEGPADPRRVLWLPLSEAAPTGIARPV